MDVQRGLNRSPGARERTTAAAAAVIACVTVVAKLLGLAEKQVLAYFFGAGELVEAYFVATGAGFAVFVLARELVEPAFVPLFVSARSHGERRAARSLFQIVALAVVVLGGGLSVAAILFNHVLAAYLAPGLTASGHDAVATLICVTVPGGVLLGLSSVTYATLNAFDRFGIAAAGDVSFKALLLVGIVAAGFTPFTVVALAAGFLLGTAARLGTHLSALRDWLLEHVGGRFLQGADVRSLATLAGPVAFGALLSQVGELADNWFASTTGPGGIAARNYAKRIVDLPLLLVPYALSIVLLPRLSRLYAQAREGAFYETVTPLVQSLLYFFLPLGVCGVVLAEPIVSILLERGAFGAEARRVTAGMLAIYAVGLPVFAVETVIVSALFARRNTVVPIAIGAVGVVVNLGAVALLVPHIGISAVATAYVLAKSVKVVLLCSAFGRGRPAVVTRWLKDLPGLGVATLVAAGAGMLAAGTPWDLGGHVVGTTLLGRLVYSAFVATSVVATFAVASLLVPGFGRRATVGLWDAVNQSSKRLLRARAQ